MLMNEIMVMTRPSARYWLALLLIPFATIVAVAMPLGIYLSVAHAEPSRPLIIAIWGCLTLAVLAYCILHDPQVLTWTITKNELRRGKKRNDIVIPFEEIESIVTGMPLQCPWYLQPTRFHPGYRNLLVLRKTALLLRLQGGRLLPLNLMTAQYENGYALMEYLLRSNDSKVVGPESYTEAEIRRLTSAIGFNRIIKT